MTVAEPNVVRVLIDGHGGDEAPAVVMQALALAVARAESDVQYGVIGLADVLPEQLAASGLQDQVEFVAAEQVVEMCEPPAQALRRKRKSSMHLGARAIKAGDWDAFVSAGNTGALMAISKVVLKTLPGVDRPALAATVPNINNGRNFFLDMGANLDCTSEHLLQFALMGSCYVQATEGIASPRVGLLNVGSEEIKGTDVIKMTAERLAASDLNYIGFVEGSDLLGDRADVLVCDGFVGNIALKTMEGTARLMQHHMRQALTSSMPAKLGAVLASGGLQRLKEAIHPSRYNGAPLLGLNGVVVKSHGGADAEGLDRAIMLAEREVREDLLSSIVDSMNRSMELI